MCYNNSVNDINNGKQIMSNNIIINNNSSSIKDNFRTPLTPLHRGGLGGLNKLILSRLLYGNTLRYAFSLIELSIVLIIIGLLVAGVTGGKSLIESAKQRAFINELNGWKQAVYTFYAAQGRLPGDIKNKGEIGGSSYSNSDFPANTFASPFTAAQGQCNAPFIEMYLEGISDFKPKNGISSCNYSGASSGYLPMLRGDSLGCPLNTFKNFLSSNGYSIKGINGIYLRCYIKTKDRNSKNLIEDLKYADIKLDDGIQNAGAIRTHCNGVSNSGTDISYGYASYDEAIKGIPTNKGECSEFFYKIFDIN